MVNDTDPLTSTRNDGKVFVAATQFNLNDDEDFAIAGNLENFTVPETPPEGNVITFDK